MSKIAHIIYGVSASGKSELAKTLFEPDTVYINRDLERKRFLGLKPNDDVWSQYSFQRHVELGVSRICEELLEEAMDFYDPIVIDSTNLRVRDRRQMIERLEKNGYEVVLHNTTITDDLNVYFKTNDSRKSGRLPHWVIHNQFLRQAMNDDLPDEIFQEANVLLVELEDMNEVALKALASNSESPEWDYIQFISTRNAFDYEELEYSLFMMGFDMTKHRLFMKPNDKEMSVAEYKDLIYSKCLLNKNLVKESMMVC